MYIGRRTVDFALKHPALVTGLMLVVTVVLALFAALPSVWPERFPALHGVKVDTDPENMLPHDEPIRVFHDNMKKEMGLYDMVVVGVVNETHPQGVFNPKSLKTIYELTEYAKTLRGEKLGLADPEAGVIEADVIAPSTVDNLEQGGPGTVKFEWLMPQPPETDEEAQAVRKKAQRIPFLDGTVVSDDGKALAIYLPITSKDISYKVYAKLQAKIDTLRGEDEYHITGLPVAEDTFGVEMFKQMAISAPIAMLIIFLLMFYFFRKLSLIISPMIVAMVSVICTMSLLVMTGNTVHIMSSMIPIFIMPIAVLDAVHILSDFFDRYQKTRDRKATIVAVMDELFTPMLYTSLTTAVGFASLALTPIPPVQIFGLFIAFGVMVAWLLTVTFIPAFIMFLSDARMERFGAVHTEAHEEPATAMGRFLRLTGEVTFRRAKTIIGIVVVLIAVAVWGITRIRINDNPIKWFTPSHPIRVADRVLNAHFGGTYMAYLALESDAPMETPAEYAATLKKRMAEESKKLKADVPHAVEVFADLSAKTEALRAADADKDKLIQSLQEYADGKSWDAPETHIAAWEKALAFLGKQQPGGDLFKQPKALEYIERIQAHLSDSGVVGKSNSLSDILKTVHRELLTGKAEDFRIPETANAVAQCMVQYQNSHRPQDLWHFVSKDYGKSVLWVQLKSGDNRDMQRVVALLDAFIAKNPPPLPMIHQWFGLTYINVVWQEKMVAGMLQAFLGSFLCVFLMMTLLYRSALWGLLSMLPLTVTIALIYGMIGMVGKDYDMPVAVLSSLSLGLAVDYAIHFLARSRGFHARYGTWKDASGPVFGEPATAITRNVIVIGVGFLPLLAAPLVPYQTVGMFIAAILVTAGVASLLILPALITLLEPWLFPKTAACCLFCNCGTCVLSAVSLVALVAINVQQFFSVGWTRLSVFSGVAVVVLASVCAATSLREKCKRKEPVSNEGDPS